jgi:hypothetical protein
VLGLEVRRAFHRHRAADVHVGGLDLALGEAERPSRSKPGALEASGSIFSVSQEVLAERPLVEGELDVEGGRQRFSILSSASSVKPLAFRVEGLMPGACQRAVADGIGFDLGDLASR